jgi:hypothetical protein
VKTAKLLDHIRKDEDILIKVKWMPLEYFYKFRLLTIAHKAFYNLDLEEINYLVVKSSNTYNLRKSLNIDVNKPRTVGRRTFSYRAAIAWNSLSDKIRHFSNPIAFKNRLKLSKQCIKNIKFEKGSSVIYNLYYY